MEIINLNLIPGKAWPVAHATQFDKGREFRANLFEGSQVYTLAGDETVDAIIKKPDGNQVIETLVNTADNYVIVTTTEQMTAVAGPSLGEIRISKGDTVIGSLKFILECEQSADTGIESHSEINNLEAQVAAIVADQYAAENVVFDDHPTAGHGTGYVVKSENVPDELNDLDDVEIDSPSSNQALVYDPVTGKWVNGEVSTVGSIDDLDDVDTTGKAEGDNLRYDGNEWVAKPNTIEMTLSEWNAIADKQAWRNAHKNTYLVISDAPNLNETAQDISYDGSTDTVWDKVEALKWVDATAEFTKGSAFDTTQSSYILYNDALKMYAVSFAVKANSADNAVIFSSVPQLKNDIIVLPTGFANAGGLSVTQASCVYYKANNNIVLRISTTTNVPVFVTAFLLKA